MKKHYLQALSVTLGAATLAATILAVGNVFAGPPAPPPLVWETVVNNSDHMPQSGGKIFNSYNQPSINGYGQVVLRARSKGGGNHGGGGGHEGGGGDEGSGGSGGEGGEGSGSGGHHGHGNGPTHGIYFIDMDTDDRQILRILDRTTEVPGPNNLGTAFIETPSFPRIAMWFDTIATRGNHQPLWEYTLDGEHTRTGTTGIYTNPFGPLITGAGKLGDVADFSFFEVPEAPGTRFEVFPGSPAVTDAGIIVFKGNYLSPDPEVGKTGVYYRQVSAGEAGGNGPIQLVANSDTMVPNPGKCAPGTTFGSTAPPSAAWNHMVFVGFDDEEDPDCGGIYRASLTGKLKLTTLVGLETEVPGQGGATFTRIGEGLSYDGRFVAFWGAWGDDTRTVRLYCREEGNKIRRDFCNNAGDFAPDQGDENSNCEEGPPCYQEKEVPVNQGIFVYDTVGKGKLWMVARAGSDGDFDDFDDFVYWNYSGAPPGAGEDDGEPPRWRSSSFVAVSQRAGPTFRAAFLAKSGDIDPGTNLYDDPIDGIYLVEELGASRPTLTPLFQTGMDGTVLDPQALDADTNQPLPITSLGLERDSFRGRWLAINASMGNEESGWAGIYVTKMPLLED
ncbi:MAG: hypothetical protein P8Y08_07015 [Desulfobulbaceae bacterium]|jgi:hypothetical protein